MSYALSRNGSAVAEVVDRLEHDGKTYKLEETMKGKGVFALKGEAKRTSTGTVAADGLRPQKYEDKRKGRERQHEFDPKAPAPTLQRQDQLSFAWTFAFAPPKGAVTVSVADGNHVTSYTYEPAGRERVKTPAGEFEALKLVKKKKDPKDKGTEIWLATDRQNLPVKIAVEDKDGTRLEQVATKIAAQ
ncbi:MAG TPA: DUF3108 domain-containing protein [Burkholderiales bacterium]|nr:DUF3108 domain-containing protein [Burkholderiales bacterium]